MVIIIPYNIASPTCPFLLKLVFSSMGTPVLAIKADISLWYSGHARGVTVCSRALPSMCATEGTSTSFSGRMVAGVGESGGVYWDC